MHTIKSHQKARGFTVTEMIIVMVIMGVLATLIVPALFGSVADARAKKTQHALNQVEQAKIHYYLDKKTTAEPALADLAAYIRNERSQNGGAEMFYTQEGWIAAGNPANSNAGALLDGVKGSYRIKPNAQGDAPQLIAVP